MIDINTKILGLMGYPLAHSLSPRLHNYYIKEHDLNYIYLPFEVKQENFADAVAGLKAINFRGVNITIPYKEKIIDYLDSISEQAQHIGAVNTVVNENGCLSGYNTDAPGFIRMLKEDGGFDIEEKKAVIIGAGGASKAVGFALCKNGIKEILLLNRTPARANELVEIWQEIYPDVIMNYGGLKDDSYKEIFKKFHLIIDTTPVGMAPETDVKPVISPQYLHSDLLIVDLVYNPLETVLIREAKKLGARTLNGMSMLLYQGIESFSLWTGIKPEDTGLKNGLFDR